MLDPELTRNPPGEFDVFQPGPAAANSQAPGPGPAPEAAAGDGSQDGGRPGPSAARSIEVTLGDLGDDLEQHFYRRLELWDRQAGQLVTESVPGEIDGERHALVLRLCYRLQLEPGRRAPASTGSITRRRPCLRTAYTTGHGARTACCCPLPRSRRAGR